MKLSPTAYVILGFLAWRPMSGYDIKALVDESTRFFWAASYGQIYPELRRLADAGLIEPAEAAEGGRRRQEHALTGGGREALEGWLATEPDTFELRDEGLLKLFFASASPETAVETLVAKRAHHAENLTRFRALEASGKPVGFALQTLRYGIEMQEWSVSWCDRAIADLDPARRAA
jgi:DNA-binding PadR family transcriptional regulator